MKTKTVFLALFTILAGISFSETISEIQGTKMYSNFENKVVKKVEGVVTAVKKNKNNNGFFMQSKKADNDFKTSEGIYVENKSGIEVKVGDFIRVDGTVKETYLSKPDKSQPPVTSIEATKIKILK